MAELQKNYKEAQRLMGTVQEQLDADIENPHGSCSQSDTQPSQVYEEQLATTEDEGDPNQGQQEENMQEEMRQTRGSVSKGNARTRKRGRAGARQQVDEEVEATEETEAGTQEENPRR
jgi:hypothetical protein